MSYSVGKNPSKVGIPQEKRVKLIAKTIDTIS